MTEYQRLALCRAIFEEAFHDMRRAIPDIVGSVLERYGFVPPSRRVVVQALTPVWVVKEKEAHG